MGPDLTRFATPPVWDALNDICDRRGLQFDKCREQIVQQRTSMISLDQVRKGQVVGDLVGYFREQRQALLRSKLETETAELDKLRCAIFSIALVSAFVESLFSKMEYNQNKREKKGRKKS